ncbi:MAG TPA: hypothetical protein VMY42_01715, partial [Thermoguttaceae bacterium]|nr:hypothetical protein [Thermoguttaceae bacterium]
MSRRIVTAICVLAGLIGSSAEAFGAEFLVGTAVTDITPYEPVAVSGQFHLRIARTVESPVTANVVALESRQDDRSLDAAIMVSCDLVYITTDVLNLVREQVKQRLPELDTTKIFLNATHTHTAPVTLPGKYAIPEDGVISAEKYRSFLVERVAEAIVRAWTGRRRGSVAWGLGHAVVAYNRRAVYADGRAQMYGRTDLPDFRQLEGYEDHDVGTLFFFDASDELIAVAVNVSCPSQEVESRTAVNADFWHP